MIILTGIKRRQRTVPDLNGIGEGSNSERLVEENEVVVRVFSDECEVEECGEM